MVKVGLVALDGMKMGRGRSALSANHGRKDIVNRSPRPMRLRAPCSLRTARAASRLRNCATARRARFLAPAPLAVGPVSPSR